MAMKTLACGNLAQAYSSGRWEYTNYDAAYAGATGGTVFPAYVLRFDVPAFVGLSEALDVALVSYMGQGEEVTLRWALCSSDANRALYAGTTAEVADSYQIASGTVTISGVTSTTESRSFQIPCTKLKGGNAYYLFLWAYNSTGLSIRAVTSDWGSHSVALGYNVGVVRVKTAEGVKMFALYTGDKRQMIPYIKTAAGIKPGG